MILSMIWKICSICFGGEEMGITKASNGLLGIGYRVLRSLEGYDSVSSKPST